MAIVSPLVRRGALADADQLAGLAPGPALAAHARLLTLLGSEEPLPVLLDALARSIETWAPSLLCSILLADHDRGVLTLGAAPRLARSYLDAVGEVPIRDGSGCCGTAAATGESVIVADIAESPLWEGYAPSALAHGLRACWSVPMLDESGQVLGTLALYFPEPRSPTQTERELVDFAAALCRMVLLHHREAEERRTQTRRLRVLMRHIPDGVVVLQDGRIVYGNDAACEMLQLPVSTGPMDLPAASHLHVDPEFLQSPASPRRHDALWKRRGGAPLPVEIIAVDVPDATHRRIVLTARDLSAREDLEHAALEAAERDRERTANDLHDGICQQLAGIDYLLTAMIARAAPDQIAALREVRTQVEFALRDTSLMAAWLLPLNHHPHGLASGLAQLRRAVLASRELQFDLDCDAAFARDLPETIAVPLFALVRSATLLALTAQPATRIAIRIDGTAHSPRAVIDVDNTRFHDATAQVELRALRYRARRVGAIVSLEAGAAGGSRCIIGFA